MNWINFKLINKGDSRLYLKGEWDITDYDEDSNDGEWSYEQNTGLMGNHIPSYWKVDGENLSEDYAWFVRSIDWQRVRELLFENIDANKTVDFGDYILKINEGAFVDMEIHKHSNFEDTFRANLIFKYNSELIEFDEDIIKDLADDLIYDDEYCEVTSSSSIDLELPKGFSEYSESCEQDIAEIISEMTQTVRKYFARQLSRDAGIYASFGEYMEQCVEDLIESDAIAMFKFKVAIENDSIEKWLNDYDFEKEEE